MARKQQIEGAAQQRNMCVGGKGNIHTALIREFIAGAEWADKTMIDKAVKWLQEQEEMVGISFQEDFIERFREAMEE